MVVTVYEADKLAMDNNIYQILRTLIASQGQPQVEQHITMTSQALTAPQQRVFSDISIPCPPRSAQSLQRRALWRSRHIFFFTPQVLVNDLSRDTCPTLLVRMLTRSHTKLCVSLTPTQIKGET
ncbi:unnamed protein product [Oncorhynchus mykiss]|uniref:Uncharacterized protein n=1 Tax=Oncorhynchus mykiss TaxID=8022 RepID=A0A060XIM8_ONCMY|nr:unnamed protein product [Oncorhynchus mykiss]